MKAPAWLWLKPLLPDTVDGFQHKTCSNTRGRSFLPLNFPSIHQIFGNYGRASIQLQSAGYCLLPCKGMLTTEKLDAHSCLYCFHLNLQTIINVDTHIYLISVDNVVPQACRLGFNLNFKHLRLFIKYRVIYCFPCKPSICEHWQTVRLNGWGHAHWWAAGPLQVGVHDQKNFQKVLKDCY